MKVFHTFAWFTIESCMVYVLHSGVRKRSDRRAGIAAAVVAVETLVFAGRAGHAVPAAAAEFGPDDRDHLDASVAQGYKQLRLVETAGDYWASERQQWDSANNAVALEPGVVLIYDRNTQTTHGFSYHVHERTSKCRSLYPHTRVLTGYLSRDIAGRREAAFSHAPEPPRL